ncbi:RNA polymerase sigma-70 factor, ECF subfamily [Parapedobacter composti]|uniref:RNA polymerase sigma-70 factor, ECF subfamily n=1 Tax=Parapedobacter composti TaxID=623281 RepID=A0A1I1I3K2_9SPHI|nr:sigma-70 family RNA polymerase sigma factor [Parapedobacter composti]SFC30615.1 RNA polymerase sigma-70 factor, ECF subfamily [Parapedobacter composti]
MDKGYQQLLFPYAYNILGSAEDALDAVQDVLLKYISRSNEAIEDERNYLIRSVINQAINIKNRNQRYVQRDDVWLPEPVATDRADRELHLKEVLSYSLLVLLERLNAQERAVFILYESFDYSHQEIADTLDISLENSRKLLSRARTKLLKKGKDTGRPVAVEKKRLLTQLNRYMEALRSGNMAHVEELLTADIVFYADGGSKLNVVKKVCIGSAEVANLVVTVYERYHARYRLVVEEVNHQPALLYYDGDHLKSCQVFEISPKDGKIIQINSVVDPDKLNRLMRSRAS